MGCHMGVTWVWWLRDVWISNQVDCYIQDT